MAGSGPGSGPSELPDQLLPMLAVAGQLPPDGQAWAFEFKWDGVRALAECEAGAVRLRSRRGNEITGGFPELEGLGRALGGRRAVLDGELVALDERGRPSFSLLQQRLGVTDPRAAALRSARITVAYLVFDLLDLEGTSLLQVPYEGRREALEGLSLAGPNWQTPRAVTGDGDRVLAAARRLGLEGVVAKRLDSLYEPGRRSRAWLKIKLNRHEEFVVGGWLAGQGGRSGWMGSLLLGQYDADAATAVRRDVPPRLVYSGSVGTGFSHDELRLLQSMLDDLRCDASPFGLGQPRPGAVWVRPELVVEVSYREWTPAGVIRNPSYLGRRSDKLPADVVRGREETA